MLKEWSCGNKCGTRTCCSYMFLHLNTNEQLKDFMMTASFVVKSSYSDFNWIKCHEDFTVTKLAKGMRRISMRKGTRFKLETNPHDKRKYIYLPDSRCKHLNDDKTCAIYRSRPIVCKIAPCLFKNSAEKYLWFGRPIRGEIDDKKNV